MRSFSPFSRSLQEVCVIARGEHLEAIKKNGLKLLIGGQEKVAHVPASDNPADFGHQDYVLCALKAHQSHESAAAFKPLLGPNTAMVTAMNGIPWWYFYKEGGKFEGRKLDSVDPGGSQWDLIGPERAIGCVVDPACEVIAPGVIEHHEFNRFIIGEPDGSRSERVVKLAEALTAANFDAPDPRCHTLERLAETLGQCLLQSDQCAHQSDTGSHHVRASLAHRLHGCHERNESRHRSAECADSGRHAGAASECRRSGGRTQDVDAPGSGASPIDGNRCLGHGRTGTRTS